MSRNSQQSTLENLKPTHLLTHFSTCLAVSYLLTIIWRKTQRTQNPPGFGPWGFDSPSRHQHSPGYGNRKSHKHIEPSCRNDLAQRQARRSLTSSPQELPKEQEKLFRDVLMLLQKQAIPFAVSGAPALQQHCGTCRDIRDLDIFLLARRRRSADGFCRRPHHQRPPGPSSRV